MSVFAKLRDAYDQFVTIKNFFNETEPAEQAAARPAQSAQPASEDIDPLDPKNWSVKKVVGAAAVVFGLAYVKHVVTRTLDKATTKVLAPVTNNSIISRLASFQGPSKAVLILTACAIAYISFQENLEEGHMTHEREKVEAQILAEHKKANPFFPNSVFYDEFEANRRSQLAALRKQL